MRLWAVGRPADITSPIVCLEVRRLISASLFPRGVPSCGLCQASQRPFDGLGGASVLYCLFWVIMYYCYTILLAMLEIMDIILMEYYGILNGSPVWRSTVLLCETCHTNRDVHVCKINYWYDYSMNIYCGYWMYFYSMCCLYHVNNFLMWTNK